MLLTLFFHTLFDTTTYVTFREKNITVITFITCAPQIIEGHVFSEHYPRAALIVYIQLPAPQALWCLLKDCGENQSHSRG